jgi:transposase-like protein
MPDNASSHKVDDLVASLGIDAGISKSEVSRICAELDAVVAGFRDRPLGHTQLPYLFLAATYVKAGHPSRSRDTCRNSRASHQYHTECHHRCRATRRSRV